MGVPVLKSTLTYSVFDYDTKSYNYFQAPGSPPRGQRAVSGRGEHGLSPEALLAPLPSNAVSIGSGKEPRGILARRGGGSLAGLGMFEMPLGIPKWALLGSVALGAYVYYRHRTKK